VRVVIFVTLSDVGASSFYAAELVLAIDHLHSLGIIYR